MMATSKTIIAMMFWSVHLLSIGLPDELDSVSNLAVSERPEHIALKLKEYASQFSSSVMSFTATERGSKEVDSFKIVDSKQVQESKLVKGKLVHELVLSSSLRYAKIQNLDGSATLITYDGKDGKRYGFKNKVMTYVDHFCDFPSLRSMTLDKFVEITGATTFRESSNSNLASRVEGYSWGERRLDPKLGECIVLQKETRGKGLSLNRNAMYFGIRDSFLVLLREEAMSKEENPEPINGAPALLKYKWLNEYEYGRKFGKLLPESWTYLISLEYSDLEDRLLPVFDGLRMNPNIIRSTTTTISNCKFPDRFPIKIFNIAIDPKTALVDSCQQAAQSEVAREQNSERSSSKWLLSLCLISCAIAAYFYARSRRK